MGIRLLNKFLKIKCRKHIQTTSLTKFNNTQIVVDANIYIYKYKGECALYENMFLMCSLFRKHKITPLFVFDGKQEEDKKEELKIRADNKKQAEQTYKTYEIKLSSGCAKHEEETIKNKMYKLKKQMIKVKRDEIKQVKEILQCYGMSYIDAPYEADVLCAYLCNKKEFAGCMSDDTDMHVYGTFPVLKYLNLLNETVVVYDMCNILKSLNITHDELKRICILSGTDYNVRAKYKSANTIFSYFKEKFLFDRSSFDDIFEYERSKNELIDIELLQSIYKKYDVDSYTLDKYDNLFVENGPYNLKQLKLLMNKYDFYFIHT